MAVPEAISPGISRPSASKAAQHLQIGVGEVRRAFGEIRGDQHIPVAQVEAAQRQHPLRIAAARHDLPAEQVMRILRARLDALREGEGDVEPPVAIVHIAGPDLQMLAGDPRRRRVALAQFDGADRRMFEIRRQVIAAALDAQMGVVDDEGIDPRHPAADVVQAAVDRRLVRAFGKQGRRAGLVRFVIGVDLEPVPMRRLDGDGERVLPQPLVGAGEVLELRVVGRGQKTAAPVGVVAPTHPAHAAFGQPPHHGVDVRGGYLHDQRVVREVHQRFEGELVVYRHGVCP